MILIQYSDYNNCDPLAENIQESILKTMVKYKNHSSILTLGELCKKNPLLSFRCADKDETLKEVLNLDASKACQDSDILSRIFKVNADIFTDFLHSGFNNSIHQSEFLSILKLAYITPAFKRSDRNYKKKYTPVSILSNISKIFEQCMFCQISSFMEIYLAKQQCGFAASIACW